MSDKKRDTTRTIISLVTLIALGAICWKVLTPLVEAAGSGTKAGAAAHADGPVTIRTFTKEGVLSEPVTTDPVVLSETEWKAKLTPEQYNILRPERHRAGRHRRITQE